jgi:hypothetical protein
MDRLQVNEVASLRKEVDRLKAAMQVLDDGGKNAFVWAPVAGKEDPELVEVRQFAREVLEGKR